MPHVPLLSPTLTVTQVADGLHLASTGLVNWILAEEGGQVTLVDAGYPGDSGRVVESLARIGRTPADIAAVLVTHAHVDHIGGIPDLHELGDFPVLTGEVEAAHARREFLQQASELDVALRAWQPRVLAWSLRILPLGATQEVTVAAAEALTTGTPLDLPGGPVAVPTPGHTSGHTAYHFPGLGAVASGDALVSGHPVTGCQHPHLLPSYFTHDQERSEASLDTFAALDADVLLPGHGPVWRGPIADAVAQARS